MNKLRGKTSIYRSITIAAVLLVATVVISVAVAVIFNAMPHRSNPPVALASNDADTFGWVTFYSLPDNDPPGSRIIAYPRLHAKAGGTGTYKDPQTFASAHPDVYPAGTKIYVPRFQRYYIMEDLCECSHGANHVDLWLEPSGTTSQVLACEEVLTTARREETIIKDPDPNQSVDLRPLMSNGTCRVSYP